jgi:hypothetical protein
MHDTTREAAAVQARALRSLTPEARVALALEASDWLRRLARVRTEQGPPNGRPELPGPPAKRSSAVRP